MFLVPRTSAWFVLQLHLSLSSLGNVQEDCYFVNMIFTDGRKICCWHFDIFTCFRRPWMWKCVIHIDRLWLWLWPNQSWNFDGFSCLQPLKNYCLLHGRPTDIVSARLRGTVARCSFILSLWLIDRIVITSGSYWPTQMGSCAK